MCLQFYNTQNASAKFHRYEQCNANKLFFTVNVTFIEKKHNRSFTQLSESDV